MMIGDKGAKSRGFLAGKEQTFGEQGARPGGKSGEGREGCGGTHLREVEQCWVRRSWWSFTD